MLTNLAILTDWNTRWHDPLVYIELGILLIVFFLSIFLITRLLKRKVIYWFYPIAFALDLLAFILEFNYAFIAISIIISICSILFLFVNLGEVRAFLANPLNKNKTSSATTAEVNAEDIYKKLDTAVKWFSKSKTGALITLERKTPLSSIIKSGNGTILNAPITPELLETIFYEGTRLHDGAVVIKGSTIVAASVFYTPSTRGLTGKYGARHRAALGISEVTDSVTIVVSEETGRVALAYAGSLEPVVIDEFLSVLTEAMSSTPAESIKE